MKLELTLRRELIVDIGSSHTVIASRHKPQLYRVPSQAKITAVPAAPLPSARRSATRPANRPRENEAEQVLVMPVQHGKVVDAFAMEQVLKRVVKKAGTRWAFLAPRSVAALLVSPALPEEEISRMRAILIDVGFSRMNLIHAPFAAARGCGLPTDIPQGRMLMDLGGGKVYFAIFSMGELAAWWQEDFGGQDLDEAIVRYIARRYRASISRDAAEQVKLSIGSVYPAEKPQSMEVTAHDLFTGEGRQLSLGDSEIRDVLSDAFETVLLGFQRGFEDVSPEIAGDIARYGVILLGGGALLQGLPAFLAERTGLEFRLATDPSDAAVLGARGMLAEGKNGGRRHA